MSRAPSLAESTCSFSSDSGDETEGTASISAKFVPLERRTSSISELVHATFLRKRLSKRSSLPWGNRRSTMIGASCFLFLIPIPFLLDACCPFAAFMLAAVTISSFSSDYLNSGVESWCHLIDRILAPLAFAANFYAVYSLFGLVWAFSSFIALAFHIKAMNFSKQNNYDKFVIFHSLWHVMGPGLILLSFAGNSYGEGLKVMVANEEF